MKKEYHIEGKFDEDITEDFIDRLLDDLYTYFKDKGIGVLPESVKLQKKVVTYIQVDDEVIEELIDEKIKELEQKGDTERYGVTVDKVCKEILK